MKFHHRVYVTLLTSLLAPVIFADSGSAEAISKVDFVGIANHSRYQGPASFAGSPVGFGGATSPSAMAELSGEGFVTVVSLRLSSEDGADIDGSRAAAGAAGLNYIHLPFDPKSSTPYDVDRFLAVVSDKTNQPVYIHCGSATRAAALWMIGRVQQDALAIDAANSEGALIAEKPEGALRLFSAYMDRPVD